MEIIKDLGKAIPFVVYSNRNFVITEEAKQILSNPLYKQIGIISLVGKYRTGKSFLLNRVLLNQKNSNGFNVGPTIKPCTKGIWMWSNPIVIENNHSKEKFYSFFIDTEGLGAYDEEINHDSKIFLVAVLISSLFILNSFGNIDENAINSLSFIINLSKTIKLTQNSNEANPDDLAAYFPSLLWLLRDFSLKLEDTHGNVITAKQYLENALQLQKGSSEAVEEKNKVRKLITAYFKERDCFSMVRPVENEKDLQNLQTLDDGLIRREFHEQAETLRNKVFKKVKPKIFNSKILSGPMLIELLENIIDSINKGAVPVIENSWKYMLHNVSVKNMNNCLEKFRQKINEFKENNKENPSFFKDLKKFEQEMINNLIQEFQKESLGPDSPETLEFSNKLKSKIHDEFDKFNEDNSRLFENRMNDLMERNLKKMQEAFESDKYTKNYYIFFRDLENLKEATETSIPDFKNKKELIYEKMIGLIKKFIEMTFLKNKILNEKEIAALKHEIQSLQNKLKDKDDEYDKLKGDSAINLEKFNTANVELKLKEKTFEEKFKQLLNEKKNVNIAAEEKIKTIQNEMNSKIEKLKGEINKAEADLKNKDDHLMMIKYSEDKMSALNSQKLEYLERDILSYKERMESMKYDNASLKATIEEQNQKIEDLKNQINQKKIVEMENDRLKKENEIILTRNRSSNLFFSSPNLNSNMNSQRNNDPYSGEEENLCISANNYGDGNIPINVDNLDPNSEAYILLHLIKEVMNKQNSDNSITLSGQFENVKNLIEKLSKENEEYLNMNKNFLENFSNFEKRYSILEEKYKNLKKLKQSVFQAAGLLCRICNKVVDLNTFLSGHYNTCTLKRKNNDLTNISDKLKIKILKGALNKDELGKPYIEYITEVNYDSQIWRVVKKFNQYAYFHKSLKSIMGDDFKFPDSANIFVKIMENNNFHENKIKQLESYVREISSIPAICNSKIFRKFFEFHINLEDELNDDIENLERNSSNLMNFNSNNFARMSIGDNLSENSDSNKEDFNRKNFSSSFKNISEMNSPKVNIYSNTEIKNSLDNLTFGNKGRISDKLNIYRNDDNYK